MTPIPAGMVSAQGSEENSHQEESRNQLPPQLLHVLTCSLPLAATPPKVGSEIP